ncbi:MAG: hypothetical protein KGM44_05035 [bacterium]|nr:hypothetical protein [bacterium]
MLATDRLTADAFATRVREELERCAVGRDHPVHQMLVTGVLNTSTLRTLAVQQWAFHVTFPSFLATLAGGCPDRAWRARLLRDAHEQDRQPGMIGRCEEWARVCAVWGISTTELEAGELLPTTEAMLAIQDYIAHRPFAEGFAGLMIAVNGEALPHMDARREAMVRCYGIDGTALAYFDGYTNGDPQALLDEWSAVVHRHTPTRSAQEEALRALRLVLHARWEYFTGIGRASGITVSRGDADERTV